MPRAAKSMPAKPAAVREVEAFAATALDDAWARLGNRPKLSDSDLDAWIAACRADRARWTIKDRKRANKEDD